MTIAGWRARAALALIAGMAGSAAAQDSAAPASPTTRAAQAEAATRLPPEGTRDADNVRRGFLATRADPVILNSEGKPVWNLDTYAFVEGPAPDTVNPSLWRHMTHLKNHGLFAVTKDVWQVRGFDATGTLLSKLMGKGEAQARRDLMELRGDEVEVDV